MSNETVVGITAFVIGVVVGAIGMIVYLVAALP